MFSAELGPGIAANPYIAFDLKVPGPGTLELTWRDDAGDKTRAADGAQRRLTNG